MSLQDEARKAQIKKKPPEKVAESCMFERLIKFGAAQAGSRQFYPFGDLPTKKKKFLRAILARTDGRTMTSGFRFDMVRVNMKCDRASSGADGAE